MLYNKDNSEYPNWILAQDKFIPEENIKAETLMCQGNGYICVRASDEERYKEQLRYELVAGTFDKPEDDVTELPNMADITYMGIKINGQTLDLNKGKYSDYSKTLNLRTSLFERTFNWESGNGDVTHFCFKKAVSLDDVHLIISHCEITPANDCIINIETGIVQENRARDTHFSETFRSINDQYIQYGETTNESKIYCVTTTLVNIWCNGIKIKTEKYNTTDLLYKYIINASADDNVIIEKQTVVYTSRDKELESLNNNEINNIAIRNLLQNSKKNFLKLFVASAAAWETKVWNIKDVKINSDDGFDNFAYRFAVYHLTVMSPVHDNRMNIGAKGLSGPGYKGHAFWDTEVYMLPFFIFTDPKAARSLIESRYYGLDGAHKKAKDNGYEGAMFPWESAWITDSEVTPSCARTGLLEHHITADVAYGVYYYYSVSGDEEFMNEYGYELIFDTAKYWQSRVTYEKGKGYVINGVIGPDEYTEDVNNNAFTNYTAKLNMDIAIKYYDKLKKENIDLWNKLDRKLSIEDIYPEWKEKTKKIFLPKPNEDGILPQDDKYLSLKYVDLTEHKAGLKNIFDIYPNVNELQVSKQADVMVLFLLLEDLFSDEIKKKNFYFYEARTTHDSSLSLSSYSILAADIKEKQEAYELFSKACRIDLSNKPHSSDDGVHSASLGGIWQCTVLGFMGIRLYGKYLRIQPNLPEKWKSAEAKIYWHGQLLKIFVTKEKLIINRLTGDEPVSFMINNEIVTFENTITINI